MPSKNEISFRVKIILSDFVNISPEKIKSEHVLQDPPLRMDSTSLAFLALSLRGYVKAFKPEQTVLVNELRKKGLSVSGLVDLIDKKLNG